LDEMVFFAVEGAEDLVEAEVGAEFAFGGYDVYVAGADGGVEDVVVGVELWFLGSPSEGFCSAGYLRKIIWRMGK